jgi:hypothetical protein
VAGGVTPGPPAAEGRMKVVELEYEVEPKPRNGGAPNPLLREIIARDLPRYADHLQYLTAIREEFFDLQVEPDLQNPSAPNWENGFLPGLDIVGLHGMLRRYKPGRYIEIGSGNSTKVARRAIAMHHLDTRIISIDPCPRADIDALCDRMLRTRLEDLDLQEALGLQPGDFLFFDGSHHAFMNSDVTVLFLEILPQLKPGVFVHIHDICLPYDYPAAWWNRFYSEQYLLGCALLFGPDRFQIELPNMFLSKDPETSGAVRELWNHPKLEGARHRHGASFWFRIPGAPERES